jgi:hypothetical protein
MRLYLDVSANRHLVMAEQCTPVFRLERPPSPFVNQPIASGDLMAVQIRVSPFCPSPELAKQVSRLRRKGCFAHSNGEVLAPTPDDEVKLTNQLALSGCGVVRHHLLQLCSMSFLTLLTGHDQGLESAFGCVFPKRILPDLEP